MFKKQFFKALSLGTSLLVAVHATQALAFDELNEAQSWIYDRSHLANTKEGQKLTYRYAGADGVDMTVDDEASVLIVATHDDGRRDVEVDFLSDERRLDLPPFRGFRGNPVIIAMLEHVAQNMSEQSGGGALYFRNRIRDSLASKEVELRQEPVSVAGKEYAATSLTFYPFSNDKYLSGNELMKTAKFSIELSDDVPGGVISVQVSAKTDDEVFERSLSLN